MSDERNHNWIPVLFFMLTGMIIGVSLYLIMTSAVDMEARAHAGSKGVVTSPAAAATGDTMRSQVVLRRDVRTRLGKVDLIYRGVEKDKMRVDVFIRELDPDYPYRREISPRAASEGFRLGGVRFELISAGRKTAKLVWIRGS